MKRLLLSMAFLLIAGTDLPAQYPTRSQMQQKPDPIVQKIVDEETQNSQLKALAHELMDKIGPRLVGTPKMQQAHDWAAVKYRSWGINARNEKWGEWRGWDRGISHIDMVAPWVKTLAGTQLAWSPSTKGKTISAEVVILPDLADSAAYASWLPETKGKFVMISMLQPTGRPDSDWKEYGTEESVKKINHQRDSLTKAWAQRISRSGYNTRTLPVALSGYYYKLLE